MKPVWPVAFHVLLADKMVVSNTTCCQSLPRLTNWDQIPIRTATKIPPVAEYIMLSGMRVNLSVRACEKLVSSINSLDHSSQDERKTESIDAKLWPITMDEPEWNR